MIAPALRRAELLDSAAEYAARARARSVRLSVLLAVFLAIAFAIVAAICFEAPDAAIYGPLIALCAVAFLALPLVIWNNPRVGFYLLVGAACLFLQAPPTIDHDVASRVPLFWNISTIGEYYAHTTALSFLHMNLAEGIMLLTALFWVMRQVALREVRFTCGQFFGWLALYFVWCLWGFIHGLEKGGDITFALWELRAQGYFLLAYLMATNLVTDRRHAITVLWIITICVGIKSIFGTANYFNNPNVDPDEGVLSHEDSLLLDIVLVACLVFWISGVLPRLRWALLAIAPTAIIADLANGRRAAVAAVIIAVPIAILICAVIMKERRKTLTAFLIALGIGTAVYLPVAWNGHGVWALPARAIKSQSSPDERDASSDSYRLAENYNLRLTRDTSPWLGFGYGRPYIVAMAQPGRTDVFSNILPHNGILWVWMRLGHIGFLLFWMFVATVLIRGPNLLKSVTSRELKAVGVLAVSSFLMLIIYGQYDLAFANYRAMWITATMLGLLATLQRLDVAPDTVGEVRARVVQGRRRRLPAAFESDDGADDTDLAPPDRTAWRSSRAW